MQYSKQTHKDTKFEAFLSLSALIKWSISLLFYYSIVMRRKLHIDQYQRQNAIIFLFLLRFRLTVEREHIWKWPIKFSYSMESKWKLKSVAECEFIA